jgi:signal transduction histidine kinase
MTIAGLTDPERLAGIEDFEMLGQPPRDDLHALSDLAARICGTPASAISILTDSEQHYLATVGFANGPCAVQDSLCVHTLRATEPVVVPDCREHPLYADNPFVNGVLNSVRFYAAVRLVSRGGLVLGTLCVFDFEVRHLDASQVDSLVTLADRVVDVLELSLRTRELAASLAEVEAMRAELERSNERLGTFAGQVSHDLKTPLTSLALSLALAREELTEAQVVDGAHRGAEAPDSDTSDVVPLLDRAIDGSARMAVLIDGLLAFARVGGQLGLVDVDLAHVLRDVRADLWERLQGVKLEVEGTLPVVTGDEVQLRALVQNLVDNAAKFTHPDRTPHVRVRAWPTDAGWRVEVVDNGRGVPADQLKWIFAPRARVDESVDGSGIGLATCRFIVEAHGGRIGVESAPSGGTTAWFELPA